jgi:hypothetical protein
MARPKTLTPLEALAHKRATSKRIRQEYLRLEVSTTDLRAFEDKFNSETSASDSRGELMLGSAIGNGCRWIRSHNSH